MTEDTCRCLACLVRRAIEQPAVLPRSSRWPKGNQVILFPCYECHNEFYVAAREVLMVWTNWNQATVSTMCPRCEQVAAVEVVDGWLLGVLHEGGVTETMPPGEEERPDLGPLSHDDILQFHNALEGRR